VGGEPRRRPALTTIADAGAADVDRAVAAARAAFEGGAWSRAAPAFRKKVMHRIADAIEAEALALAVLGVRDNGTEIGMALKAEPGSAAATFRYYAEALDKVYGEIAPTAPRTCWRWSTASLSAWSAPSCRGTSR
jgi:4-(gamma-glutamylamino)butanal dehydrogenase